MKKDRNAFFNSQSASSYFYPSAQPVMPNMGYPMATESNSSFYQGPIMNTQMADYSNELESRLAKIERQISRLDMRVSKLEGEMNTSPNTNDYTTNNMYVI